MAPRQTPFDFQERKRILLATVRDQIRLLWDGLWLPDEVETVCAADGRSALERLYGEPPDLLVVDYDLPGSPQGEVARQVKRESLFRRLPVMLLLDHAELRDFVRREPLEVDDLLVVPCSPEEASARARLIFSRTSAAFDANPLTRLPGNVAIIQRLRALIEDRREFAMAYCDLDNFKAFNDKYGFARGDEALVMTSRVVVNSVHSVAGETAFIGHVGGDDFVFIVPADMVERACALVIEKFDSIVEHFYDAEDRERGFISSIDRQGRINEYPLMTISIGVVVNWRGKLKHFGEASQTAMILNKKAKERPCSSYVLDRRMD